MIKETLQNQTIIVDVLQFSDQELSVLAKARFYGYLHQHSRIIDTIADGGAQAIRSFGRNFFTEKGIEVKFTLTMTEYEELQSILTDQFLISLHEY